MSAQGNMQNTSRPIKIDLGTQMFDLYVLHPRLATVGLLHVIGLINPCNSEINLWEMHVQTMY